MSCFSDHMWFHNGGSFLGVEDARPLLQEPTGRWEWQLESSWQDPHLGRTWEVRASPVALGGGKPVWP